MKVHFVIGRRTEDPAHLGAKIHLVEDEGDSVRTNNEGFAYKKSLESIDPTFMCDEIRNDFEIIISISDVKRMTQKVLVDYSWMHSGVPNWVVSASMEIFRAIKSEIRKKHRQYEEKYGK